MEKKYMLISVCERDIMTERFDTLEEAQRAMRGEMVEWGEVSEDIFTDDHYDDGDRGFSKMNAYVTDGANHNNLDWLIVCLEP